MVSALSTKVLTHEQKQLLKHAPITLSEYNAIAVTFLDFDDNIIAENAIITSQNGAKAVLDKKILIKNCFCVGEKTKALLEENGQNVTKMKQNASELAQFIVKSHKNDQFWFFCNNIRRHELPDILKAHHISLKELEVYKTSLNPERIEGDFDAVLFFSPSGVESYTTNNSLNNRMAFCIGETTASEVKKHTNKITVATKPTMEQLLQLLVKYSKKT